MGKWVLLGALLSISPALASLSDVDVDRPAKNLFDACLSVETRGTETGEQYAFDNAFCRGYVLASWAHSNACIGSQRLYDLVLIFNAFVRKNPVWRTRGPVPAIEAALLDAFPCPAKP